uniref:Uncharacterized protein n=1 Tax=Lactuca sativa TaxID=4236 RepID=A0A9R1XVL7_LACSA|nr:hypothetical protein LSAT_V11C200054990 [Lactuca sativa]
MEDTISSCVGQVFPDAYHECVDLLSHKNLLKHIFRLFVLPCMQSIYQLSHVAREFLPNIGNVKWEQAYFPNIRWNVLNINIP